MARKRQKSDKFTTNTLFEAQVLAVFSKNPYQYFNYKQVSAQLGINDKSDRELVKKTVTDMLQHQVLVWPRINQLCPVSSLRVSASIDSMVGIRAVNSFRSWSSSNAVSHHI